MDKSLMFLIHPLTSPLLLYNGAWIVRQIQEVKYHNISKSAFVINSFTKITV